MQDTAHKSKLSVPQIKALTDIWGEIGENSFSRLSGFSMWPFIKPGDTLVISHQVEDLKVGDVVVFQRQDKLVAHRVVKLVENESQQTAYQTKGDFNRLLDCTALSPEAILGKVIKIKSSSRTISCSSLIWRLLNYIIAVYSYHIHLIRKG